MKRLLNLFIFFGLLLSACTPPSEPPEAVATAAAMTVAAALTNSQPALASPTAKNDQEIAATQNSNEKSFASFEDVTNCRMGPGVNYDRITQITPGFSVEIIGFFPPNYWVVQTDDGPCWVAGEFVTPSGNTDAVPTVTAPPTPQADPLQNISLQNWNIFCNYENNQAQVEFSWSDEGDETGYRIIRNDVIVVELPTNSTVFTETITLLSGQTVGYSVIAYNAAGQVQSKTIILGC